jgi:hypothetical protein
MPLSQVVDMKRVLHRCAEDAPVVPTVAADLADLFGSESTLFGSVGSRAHNAGN